MDEVQTDCGKGGEGSVLEKDFGHYLATGRDWRYLDGNAGLAGSQGVVSRLRDDIGGEPAHGAYCGRQPVCGEDDSVRPGVVPETKDGLCERIAFGAIRDGIVFFGSVFDTSSPLSFRREDHCGLQLARARIALVSAGGVQEAGNAAPRRAFHGSGRGGGGQAPWCAAGVLVVQ